MSENLTDTTLSGANEKTFRAFVPFYIGQILSLLGSEIVLFAIVWFLTVESADPTILSISMFLNFIPRILFSSIAGVMADKFNKKVILAITDTLQALFTLGLIALFLLDSPGIWIVIIINIARSTCQTFQQPVSLSIIPLMVPKDKLSRINGIQQLAFGLIGIAAPVIAAFLFTFLSFQNILWVDILTFIIAISVLLRTKIPRIHENTFELGEIKEDLHPSTEIESGKNNSFISSLKEGFSVINEIRGLKAVILLAILGNFILTPIIVLLTYFVKFEHGGDATNVAFIEGAIQLGIIAGGIMVSMKKSWKNKIFSLIFGIILAIVSMGLLGIAPHGNFWFMYIVAFVGYIGIPIINTMVGTLVQSAVPVDKIGRVGANLNLLVMIITPLGYIAVGPIAEIIGTGILFLITAIIGIVMTLVIYFGSELRHLTNETFGTHKSAGNTIVISQNVPTSPESSEEV